MKMLDLLSRIISYFLLPFIFLYESFLYTPQWNQYLLKKGKHRSLFRFKPVHVDTCMEFYVRFDRTAIYTSPTREDQWDINKLWGFSENIFTPHYNSARIGWNYRDGQVYLRPYTHCEGKTQIDPPEIPIPMDQDIECLIFALKGHYAFYINGQNYHLPRASEDTNFVGLQLYPYFGGNQVPDHDINIWIKS